MATNTNDYLKFSAYSIKDLITRKLSDDSKFTDLIYEGSNLAILIDIVSYMYQCLLYNINNAASESMWADTQIYENINRLCKFIGYNPKGYGTATCIFTISNNQTKQFCQITIPRYSYIDSGKFDSRGHRICYSTAKKIQLGSDIEQDIILYNGKWKLYSTVFTSSGDEYQTFTLDGIKSDSDGNNPMYVPNDMIHVYVRTPNADGNDTIELWNAVDQGLFTDNRVENGTLIYSLNDNIFNVRLNEDKIYQITFGNNFNGKIPSKDSSIYIFYLDSNGPDGILNLGDIKDFKLHHDKTAFGIDEALYSLIFSGDITTGSQHITTELLLNSTWRNNHNSTETAKEESVDEIRKNAPQWFKLGNRLITASDWEYYIKNVFRKSNIIDVKCQNNWGYISTFYRWLYNIGVEKKQNGRYYITQAKISKNAKYSDATDCNNVYLWIKMKDDADIYTTIFDQNVQSIKAITQEPVYLKPLNVYFSICAESVENACKKYFNDNNTSFEFDSACKSYLEITIDDNVLYSPINIHSLVVNVIKSFFDELNFTLGQLVDYNELAQKILDLNGICRIRTVYFDPTDEVEQQKIINGISFATWTEGFIDLGDDLDISNTVKALEDFQFPKLYRPDLLNSKIKVIKKTLNTVNTIQY